MASTIFIITAISLIIVLEYSLMVNVKKANEDLERSMEERGQNEEEGVLSDE